jgi:hypothetical protein
VRSHDCVVCNTCSTLVCGSRAHNPVGTNQNDKLGTKLKSIKYFFMVLLKNIIFGRLSPPVRQSFGALQHQFWPHRCVSSPSQNKHSGLG